MIRVGVIGLGSMGPNHARVYSELDVSFAGVYDLDAERALSVAKRFGTTAYTNLSEMLNSVDAVTIATPTRTHHRLALEAIRAGKSVLIEKPIATTFQQAAELIDAAKLAGVTLAVGHIERHNPVVQSTKELISRGALGDVVTLASRRLSQALAPTRTQDTGVILDLAIHDIDVIQYLLGKQVKSVSAISGGATTSRGEDRASMILDFEEGVFANVEVNWTTPVKIRELTLTCTLGYLRLDYIEQIVELFRATPGVIDEFDLFNVPRQYDIRRFPLRRQEPLKNELLDFIQAVQGRRAPLVTGEDAASALLVAQAAVQAAKAKSRVEVPSIQTAVTELGASI